MVMLCPTVPCLTRKVMTFGDGSALLPGEAIDRVLRDGYPPGRPGEVYRQFLRAVEKVELDGCW
jgi:hypothetical protein